MNTDINSYIQLDRKVEKLLWKSELLGSGHNGVVYLLPNNKAIKIFKDKNVCEKEYNILKRTNKSRYFPRTYNRGEYYIIRDYVRGERLDEYIKNKKLNKAICHNLIKLIKEFKKLRFKKLDIRCKDIYVGKKNSLMVIDPKNNYSKEVLYPRHLMKGLNKLGVLEQFLAVVKEESPENYKLWNFRIKQYLEKGIK
ncbi:protein kinase family protein [Clostridium brassicae]|uniref:Protein kinase n=1 Tax=Clostridium brassicae TaxID=2999072 RepID=A0ABT4DDM7_9CLOT|nr:protein kinase [Clostridium brassicae]MCY6959316.1 protein kinase [Clostridium brassicae]